MIAIKKPYSVKCTACKNIITPDLDLECISSYERNMGMELEYEAVYEHECTSCGSQIAVYIRAWEYPVGTLEFQSVELEGAEENSEIELEAMLD